MLLRRNALNLAWIVAVAATLGSLYFSEVREFIPCDLCWFQRILMYPLSIILGIAAFHDDFKIRKYALPLSIIGMCVSTFHYMMEKIPGFEKVRPCTNGVPCTTEWINWLGFITIPFLALTGFTLITVFLLIAKKSDNE